MAKKIYKKSRKKGPALSPIEAGRRLLAAAETGGDVPVFLLFGEEQYLLELTAGKLLDRLLPKEQRDFGLQQLSGPDVTVGDLCDALSTLPLFGSRRVVVFKGCGIFGVRGKPGKKARNLKAEAVCARLPRKGEGVTVIIIEEGVDRRLSLFKEISKRGVVGEFEPFTETDDRHLRSLLLLVNDRLRSRGLEIKKKDLFYLTQLVGTDLRSLFTEVEKLSLYVGPGQEISKREIDLLVVPAREMVAYQLADIVVAGNVGEALAFLRRILGQKTPPLAVLAMIRKRYRFLLQACALFDEGILSPALGSAHYPHFRDSLGGIPENVRQAFSGKKGSNLLAEHPYVIYKICQSAQRMPMPHLRKNLDRTVRAEMELKGGRRSGEEALEDLVIALC